LTRPEVLNQIRTEEARIAAAKKNVGRKGKGKARMAQEESNTDSDISIADCIVVNVG